VTAVDKGFDSGDVAPSKTFTRTFSTAGTFAYRCNIHQYMTGSVVVQG
jgi:plastocyanin